MHAVTTPTAAQRLARTIASDIWIYNKEKIAEGLKHDNLFELLESEINEGHDHFAQRVAPEVAAQHNYLERAIVDLLIQSAAAEMPTRMW